MPQAFIDMLAGKNIGKAIVVAWIEKIIEMWNKKEVDL